MRIKVLREYHEGSTARRRITSQPWHRPLHRPTMARFELMPIDLGLSPHLGPVPAPAAAAVQAPAAPALMRAAGPALAAAAHQAACRCCHHLQHNGSDRAGQVVIPASLEVISDTQQLHIRQRVGAVITCNRKEVTERDALLWLKGNSDTWQLHIRQHVDAVIVCSIKELTGQEHTIWSGSMLMKVLAMADTRRYVYSQLAAAQPAAALSPESTAHMDCATQQATLQYYKQQNCGRADVYFQVCQHCHLRFISSKGPAAAASCLPAQPTHMHTHTHTHTPYMHLPDPSPKSAATRFYPEQCRQC
jgi:hypothetical protein